MTKRIAGLLTVLMLVLVLVSIASANIYGNTEQRESLGRSNTGGHQIVGDGGGVFTAALNSTQPIYYVYDWDLNFFSLVQTELNFIHSDWGTSEKWVGGLPSTRNSVQAP